MFWPKDVSGVDGSRKGHAIRQNVFAGNVLCSVIERDMECEWKYVPNCVEQEGL